MNGYKFCIFNTVYHDGIFSHNYETYQTVDAESEESARNMVVLKKTHTELQGGPVIDCEPWIYSVECLGRIEYQYVKTYQAGG